MSQNGAKTIVFFIILICAFIHCECFIWNIGDCAVYYDEPCKKTVVDFRLYTHENGRTSVVTLNPFKPTMPRSLKTNRGLKILIHGYGGLGIDYAIKNVTVAYKLSKVPVIIGIIVVKLSYHHSK